MKYLAVFCLLSIAGIETAFCSDPPAGMPFEHRRSRGGRTGNPTSGTRCRGNRIFVFQVLGWF